jgi:structural maintenance of chromosomes protein 6
LRKVLDPFVLRILINLAQIERIVLAESRKEGDFTLRQLRGGQAWSKDGFVVRVFPEGGVSSIKLDHMGRGNALLLTGRDTAADIQ